MAANIEVLLKHLSTEILNYDLSHISGREIVAGNPEHCINLLQLCNEISLMMGQEGDEMEESSSAAKKRAFDEQKQDLKRQLQGDLPLRMDDVSIDLEEGLASHDPAAYEDDWKQMQMQREYDPEDDEDDYHRLNDDSAAESPDPLAMAQEAMMHNQDAVDQEIEQIINKKLPQDSDSGAENHAGFVDDEVDPAQRFDQHSKQVYYDEEEYDPEEQSQD